MSAGGGVAADVSGDLPAVVGFDQRLVNLLRSAVAGEGVEFRPPAWPSKAEVYHVVDRESKETNPRFGGAISWNFNKFLVNRSGTVLARFGSRTKPDDGELIAALKRALAASE